MKFLRKFNESSSDIKEDILENFMSITDKFGEPRCISTNFGTSTKWTLEWTIQSLDFSMMQPIDDVISNLKRLTQDIDDIVDASSRLTHFDLNMSIGRKLIIELLPKSSGDSDFQFINGYGARTLSLDANDIERFFKSRGVTVSKFDIDSSYSEFNETNDLEIFLNIPNSSAREEFRDLFEAELEIKTRELDINRTFTVNLSTSKVRIQPNEEKTYIDLE